MTDNKDINLEDPYFSEAGNANGLDAIEKYDFDLKQIKKITINKNIERVYSEAFPTIMKAAIPSFILLILSFFVGIADVPFMGNIFESLSKYINPGQAVLNTDVQPVNLWWFPLVLYIIFIFCAIRANKVLRREFKDREASAESISRIIDRYSGIIDGLGTALPLLGAAILLLSIEKGPALFVGFAVPFEIKSILILAIAKLFDSVFDELALKYQEIQESIRNVERAYEYSLQSQLIKAKVLPSPESTPSKVVIESSVNKEQMDSIYETMKASQELGLNIKRLISEINNLNLPDEKYLKEIQKTSQSLSESVKMIGTTMEGFKDDNVRKSLDNLITLLNRGQNH